VGGGGGGGGGGRGRGRCPRVEGTGRNTCGGLAVMDVRIPVRASHDDPAADSVAPVEVNEPQVREEGRSERGHPGR